MKSPQSIIDFSKQSWFASAKQHQRLQADVSSASQALGIAHADHIELFFNEHCLHIKTNAALATRIRQIEPVLLEALRAKSWQIDSVKLTVVRHANALSLHLKESSWISPNEQRYGKKTLPKPELRTTLLQYIAQKRVNI